MRLLILLFLLINSTYGFNLNKPQDICKKSVLSQFSKVSLMSLILGECQKNKVEAKEIKNKFDYSNQYLTTPEPILINVIDNDIYFYSSINQKSAFELERILIEINRRQIYNNHTNYPINLHIQSYGGSLHHSLYLIDLIKNMETPVHTYIDGFAASAATLLSTAGKKRFITKNSIMLVHQLSSGFEGKYSEIHDENENINNLMNFIIRFYLENTKMKKEELRILLKRDLWLDSEKCLSFGLVDYII